MPPYGSLPQPGQAPWTTRGPREGAQKPSAEGARQFGNVWASPVAMGVISPTDPILQGWKWDQYKGEWKKDVDWAYRISLPIALGGLGAAGLSAAGVLGGAGAAGGGINPSLAAQAAGLEGAVPGLSAATIANLPGAVGIPTMAGLPAIAGIEGAPAGLPAATLANLPGAMAVPAMTDIPSWAQVSQGGTPPPSDTAGPPARGLNWQDLLAAILPAMGALGGRLTGSPSPTPFAGGDSLYPPELTELLQLAMERMRAQGPLFSAVTEQAYRGLPAYARGEAEEF